MICDDCKWITTQVESEVSDRPDNGPNFFVICGPLLFCAGQNMTCICYNPFFPFLNLREGKLVHVSVSGMQLSTLWSIQMAPLFVCVCEEDTSQTQTMHTCAQNVFNKNTIPEMLVHQEVILGQTTHMYTGC